MKKKYIPLILIALFIITFLFLMWKGWVTQNMKTEFSFIESPNKGFFQNDLGITQIGDPFVLKAADGYYYMYCTSAPNGFYCWKSTDMLTWTDKKMCYVQAPDSWNVDCFWAPEVVEYEGKYYMYYTAKNKNDSLRIGLSVSDKPDGPFVDPKNEPFFDFGYAAIDANVLIDDDGNKYLYYARDCSENIDNGIRKSEIYGVQLSDDLLSVKGEAIKLLSPEQKWEIASGDTRWNEGPEMIKNNGIYYMSYSANFFASPAYSLGYATSENPLGPFVKAEENPILTSGTRKDVSGTGHQSFTLSPDGTEIWAVYHSHTDMVNPGGDRKVNIDRAGFTKDGKLYINGPVTTVQPAPSGAGITNVTNRFNASANGMDAEILVDGFFSIYKKHGDMNIEIPATENLVTIELTAEDKTAVTSIALYPGQDGFEKVKEVQLIINDSYISEKYVILEETPSPLILSFKELEVEKMILQFLLKDGSDSVKLSEISVLQ